MTYTKHDPFSFYAVVKTQLATTGRSVGESQAPDPVVYPYLVVEPMDEDSDPDEKGTLGDAHVTTEFVWRVRTVGTTQESVLLVQRQARNVMLGWKPTVTGFSCGVVEKAGGFGVFRDDDVQPPIFDVVDEYSCFVSA